MILRIAVMLLLGCASLPLLAQDARPGGAGPGCPPAQEEEASVAHVPASTDIRTDSKDKPSRTPRGGNEENSVRIPRTHSFLPGMFR